MSYLTLALQAEARRRAQAVHSEGTTLPPGCGWGAGAGESSKARKNERSRRGPASLAAEDIRTVPVVALSVPGVEGSVWFVPDASHAMALHREGVSRGRIWTTGELKDLFVIKDRPYDIALTLVLAQFALDAKIVEVRRP